MSVTYISVAQLRTYEADPSQNAAGSGNSYTVVDIAANLESLSQSDINEMPSIGATAIAASDTPAVMSANQVTLLVNNSVAITVPPNLTAQNSNDGTTDLPNPNGMSVDITWDPSVASAPASFEATIEQGIEILERTILNQFTFNIDVGYAETGDGVNSGVNGGADPSNISSAAPSGFQSYSLTYSQLLSDLTQGEASETATSSAQLTSTNDLPNTTSLNGQSNFNIGSAEAKALTVDDPTLNLISPTASAIDGSAGFGTGFTGIGLVGAVLHEITHALGRSPGATALSLFRYLSNSTGSPQHDFNGGNPSPTNPAAASYFSIDGGVTTLAQFGTTSDQADFLNSPASTLTPNDPLDEGVAGSGQLTPQDLVMLNVLGFQINPIESFTSSYIQALNLNGLLLMLSAGVTTIDGGSLPQVTGTAAEIQSLTPQQITAIGDLGIGVTSLSSDGSVQLNAAQAQAFEAAKIGITAPSGDTVSLVDIAANIESLSAAQLAGLPSLDVSTIDATDASLSLTLDQVVGIERAAAAEGSTIPVNVPSGDTVAVAFPQTYYQNLLFDGSDSNGHSGLFALGGPFDGAGELVGVDRIAGDVVEANAIATLGHDILFDGNDLYGNDGLWISDGAVAGTNQITGIANAASAAQGGLKPTDITPFNGQALFFGTGASGTVGLWETNGTAAGTQELISGLSGSGMTVVGQQVYFVGADGGIWETDGTAASTREVFGAPGSGAGELEGAILTVPSSGFDSGGLALVNGQLVFGGYAQYTFNSTTIDIRGLFALSGGSVQAVSGIGPGEEQQVRNEVYDGANGPVVVYAPPTSLVPPQAFYQGDNYPGADDPLGGGLFAYNPTTGTVSPVEGYTPVLVSSLGEPDPVDLSVADNSLFFNGLSEQNGVIGDDLYLFGYSDTGKPISFEFGSNIAGADETQNQSDTSLGLDPQDITGLDGSVYFNGVDAAGHSGLFVLQPVNGSFFTLSPTGSFAITASGLELTGIRGASSDGLDPSDITPLNLDRPSTGDLITVAQMQTLSSSGTYVVGDTPSQIEALTSQQITLGLGFGVVAFVTGASLTIGALQAVALEGPDSFGTPVTITLPSGDLVTLADSAADIKALTPDQLAELGTLGVDAILVTGNSITFSVAQALSLEAPVSLAFPGGTVSINDTAAAVEGLAPGMISALAALGITAIAATGAPVELTLAQAEALQAASIKVTDPGHTVFYSDTAANIEALQLAQIATLKAAGVTSIDATNGSVALSVADAEALLDPVAVTVPAGDTVTIADTSGNIKTMIDTLAPAQLDALKSIGISAITTSGSLTLSLAEAEVLAGAGLQIVPEPGQFLIVSVRDTAFDIEQLTPQQIGGLGSIVLSGELVSSNASVTLSIGQAVALTEASLFVFAPSGDTVSVADTAADIDALTTTQIDSLRSAGWTSITATTGPVALSAAAAADLEGSSPFFFDGTQIEIIPPAGGTLGISISDTAAKIEALTPAEIDALPLIGVGAIEVTDTSATFTIADAEALEQAGLFGAVSVPSGNTITIADTAAEIEQELGDGGLSINELPYSVNQIVATDTSLGVTVAEAELLEYGGRGTEFPVRLSAPSGDTVALADSVANITSMPVFAFDGLSSIGVTSVAVTDPVVDASDAEALENFYTTVGTALPVTGPDGEGLTLADNAADIEGMSPTQLSDLTSIGVTAVTVTDQSITLTVAQALALYDPVPISVPPGASVIIVDTTAAIEALTPTEIAGLAAIGVNTIEVSGLTGGEALTINGGITLAVGGAVPSDDTITFTGTGGVLSLDDTAAMAGTIYGFSPPDTIDLTDVPYDASGNGSASLATDPNDNQPCIAVTENSNAYYLDIDPNQVFLTGATFNLNPDGGGTGSGTALTVVEPPVASYDWVYPGQTADGVVVGSGGTVEVESGATVNRTIVQGGGVLMADDGATIDDTVLNDGTVDFDIAGTAVFSGPLTGTGILEVSGGGDLDVASAYTGAAQIDGSSTLEFTSTYFGVANFSGSSIGPGGTMQFDAGSTGPINVVNANDIVIAQPGSDDWINAIVNYTLPANIDTLFLYAGSQGAGNSDASGDALYALDVGNAQTLTGNSANDTFVVYNSSDVVVPAAGSHDVVYAAASYALPSGVDALVLEGGATQGTGNSDAAGDALYAANPGQVATLAGNSANDTFVVYSSPDVVVPKAGSHDVVYAAASYALPSGVDVLIMEAGTQAVGNSDAVGDALFAANPNQVATLTGNSANDTFVVYNSADVVVPKAGSHDIVYSAVSYTLPTGVNSQILESGTQAVGNSDAAGDTLYAANAAIAQTLAGNSHNDTFVVYNSGDTVVGQAGSSDTVYAAAKFTLPTSVDTLFLEGPGATLGAGNGDPSDWLFGNAGAASTLVAGSGADTLYVTGTAGTIMTGGAGSDTFAFPDVMGHDEVTNFATPKDTLQFNATLFANFTAAMNAASQSGANTVFTIDANDTVTLDNVAKTSLTASNFHFS